MAGEGENNQNLFGDVNFDDFLNEFGTPPDTEGGEPTGTDTPPADPNAGGGEKENPGQSNDSNLEEPTPGDITEPQGGEPTGGDPTGEEGDGEEDGNSSPLIPYAKLLAEEGILPNFKLDEFEKEPSTEGLKAAMLAEINQGVEAYKASLPQEINHLLNNWEEGVPLSALLEIDSRKAEFKSIDEESIKDNTELQKNLIKEYYKNTTRFSDDKIDKLIQRHADLEELESEAKNSLSELVQIEEQREQQAVADAKAAKKQQEELAQKEYDDFKRAVSEATEIIPGLSITDDTKKRILNVMTTPVAQDQNGRYLNAIEKARIEDPIKFERDLAYLWLTTKGFSDYSALKGAAKNDAVNEFERSVQKFDKGNKGSFNAPKPPSNQTADNLRSAVEDFTYNTNFEDFFRKKD